MKKNPKDYIILKWGTLKGWGWGSEKMKSLLEQYFAIGSSVSAIAQKDTPEQKDLICKMIDCMPGKVYLDWDGKYVTKKEAKKYVLEY